MQMSYLHREVGERDKFDAYHNVIKQERDKLRNLSFITRALEYLSSINYNKPERDRISGCSDILDIRLRLNNEELLDFWCSNDPNLSSIYYIIDTHDSKKLDSADCTRNSNYY